MYSTLSYFEVLHIELHTIVFGMTPEERSQILVIKSTKPTNLTPPVVGFGLAVACHGVPYRMKIYTEFNLAT